MGCLLGLLFPLPAAWNGRAQTGPSAKALPRGRREREAGGSAAAPPLPHQILSGYHPPLAGMSAGLGAGPLGQPRCSSWGGGGGGAGV